MPILAGIALSDFTIDHLATILIFVLFIVCTLCIMLAIRSFTYKKLSEKYKKSISITSEREIRASEREAMARRDLEDKDNIHNAVIADIEQKHQNELALQKEQYEKSEEEERARQTTRDVNDHTVSAFTEFYQLKGSFFSQKEQRLYHFFNIFIEKFNERILKKTKSEPTYHLITKPRIMDFVEMKTNDEKEYDNYFMWLFMQRHVDYLLCKKHAPNGNKNNTLYIPIAVIELNGNTHENNYKTIYSDWLKERLFKDTLKLPFIVITNDEVEKMESATSDEFIMERIINQIPQMN